MYVFNLLEHLGSLNLLIPFHFHLVSGPHANLVDAFKAKEFPSSHVNVQTALPPAFLHSLLPLNGFPIVGHAERKIYVSQTSFKTQLPCLKI